jgi:hypothetical protein
MYSFISYEEAILIIYENDTKYLCPMLVKWYEQLHAILETPNASQLLAQKDINANAC